MPYVSYRCIGCKLIHLLHILRYVKTPIIQRAFVLVIRWHKHTSVCHKKKNLIDEMHKIIVEMHNLTNTGRIHIRQLYTIWPLRSMFLCTCARVYQYNERGT